MTSELGWLLCTALLAGSLWVPYIVGINVTDFPGKEEIFVRPPDLSRMPAWVHRSYRAHQNALEQLLPFATVVLIGAVAGVSTATTRWCALLFFGLRVVHAVGMVSGVARFPVRPAIYVSGWILMWLFASQIWAHG